MCINCQIGSVHDISDNLPGLRDVCRHYARPSPTNRWSSCEASWVCLLWWDPHVVCDNTPQIYRWNHGAHYCWNDKSSFAWAINLILPVVSYNVLYVFSIYFFISPIIIHECIDHLSHLLFTLFRHANLEEFATGITLLRFQFVLF